MSKKILNYDRKLNRKEKLLWWLGCSRKFLRLPNFVKRKDITDVKHYHSVPDIIFDGRQETPARILCNHYWSVRIPRLATFNGGKNLTCIEVGCGSGPLANTYNENNISYIGIDIKDPKILGFNSNSQKKFIKAEYLEAADVIGYGDFFTSQSALEHFDYDNEFFSRVSAARLKSAKTDYFDCHLVPSRLSLFCYLGHGVRQYSIEDIIYLYEREITAKTNLRLLFASSNLVSLVCF